MSGDLRAALRIAVLAMCFMCVCIAWFNCGIRTHDIRESSPDVDRAVPQARPQRSYLDVESIPGGLVIVVSAQETNAPLGNALATIETTNSADVVAYSNAAGVIAIQKMPKDATAVRVFAPGRARWSRVLQPGESLGPAVRLGVPLPPGVEVVGRVLDADDEQPLPNAIVTASERYTRGSEFVFGDRTIVDHSGRFVLPGVPRARSFGCDPSIVIGVSAGGYDALYQDIDIATDHGAGRELTLRMRRSGR